MKLTALGHPKIELLSMNKQNQFKLGILTISDSGAAGKRTDKSGEAIKNIFLSSEFVISAYKIVADEKDDIKKTLLHFADDLKLDIIITTGGTGLSPRDITPEATKPIIDKEIPGISEAMRMAGLAHTPYAMLSRGISGIRGQTLIINLPGSPKAVG